MKTGAEFVLLGQSGKKSDKELSVMSIYFFRSIQNFISIGLISISYFFRAQNMKRSFQ